MRQILHIDFDSFFASVEQQCQPALRNKPVGVIAQNSRTCIIAASREAKQFGVKTGSVSYLAFEKCPQLILIPADFVKYFEVSKRFLAIAKDYSPFVELFSIDEVFIDITKTLSLFGSIDGIITKIKKRIKEEIGEYISVSVGISHNKLLAKLASGLQKPNGVVAITPENLDQIYEKAQLTDICGIGERIRFRLNTLGIYTLLQLRTIPLGLLIEEFGHAEARFLKNVSYGIDGSSVIPYTQKPEVKSVGRNYCLPKNEYSQQIVLQNTYELCEEVCLKLRRLNKQARTLGISLRGNKNMNIRKTLLYPFNTTAVIFNEGIRMINLQFHYVAADYVRQISVWVSHLSDVSAAQLSLFFDVLKNKRLVTAIDSINEKFGDHTIRNGFLLYADKLTTVPNGWMADKYERTKLAREASKDF